MSAPSLPYIYALRAVTALRCLRDYFPTKIHIANTTNLQCLALNPHPLRLELLAHVGYVLFLNYDLCYIGRESANRNTNKLAKQLSLSSPSGTLS
jgi:hypothetical protein